MLPKLGHWHLLLRLLARRAPLPILHRVTIHPHPILSTGMSAHAHTASRLLGEVHSGTERWMMRVLTSVVLVQPVSVRSTMKRSAVSGMMRPSRWRAECAASEQTIAIARLSGQGDTRTERWGMPTPSTLAPCASADITIGSATARRVVVFGLRCDRRASAWLLMVVVHAEEGEEGRLSVSLTANEVTSRSGRQSRDQLGRSTGTACQSGGRRPRNSRRGGVRGRKEVRATYEVRNKILVSLLWALRRSLDQNPEEE